MTTEPRPGLRDVEPYVSPHSTGRRSPQHERVPGAAAGRVLRGPRAHGARPAAEPLPRRADDASAGGPRGARRAPVRRHVGGERVERDPDRAAARVRRPRPHGAGVRADVPAALEALDPDVHAHSSRSDSSNHSPSATARSARRRPPAPTSCSSARRTTRPATRSRSRRRARSPRRSTRS